MVIMIIMEFKPSGDITREEIWKNRDGNSFPKIKPSNFDLSYDDNVQWPEQPKLIT